MKLRFFVLLLMAMGISAFGADAVKAKVLLITGGHGFATNEFLKVFRENPQINLTHVNHAKGTASAYERDDLYHYDAVVLYDMPKEISETQKKRFMGLLEKGIGLVVLHHALVSYQHWPDYERIIGGRYPEEDGKGGVVTDKVGYEHDVKYRVNVVAKDHPVTNGVSDFEIQDEIYWGFRTGRDVKPLLTTEHPKSGKPLAWERGEGKSRIIYLQLGHGPEAFANPNYRKLVAQSIQYVSRRK
jgi:uncharacterized protein